MNPTILYISFKWPEWWILLVLIMLLGLQLFALTRQKNLSPKQKTVKTILNILVWVMIFLFVIRPSWTKTDNSSGVLIVSDGIPSAISDKMKDSLKIKETLSYKDFAGKIAEDASFTEHLGHIYVLGQEATPEILSRLSGKPVSWIPYYKVSELQHIRWSAIMRRGDVQEVTGKMEVEEAETLSIRYGNQVLDSLALKKGFNSFNLRFPAFANGRTVAELYLGDSKLREVDFFTVSKPALSILFILENPDFESKTLAEWLGKNGHRVEISTQVAKNTQNRAVINKTDKAFVPDLIITNPGNASNGMVKKAVAEGRNVLFFNLTEPFGEIKAINQALGTRWNVKRISNEESVPAGKEITALPYQLGAALNQKNIGEYPIAIQKITGKVGLSLLNETFSLKLSGDSLTYDKIWYGLLQALDPAFKDNVAISAPVIKDTRTTISINNISSSAQNLHVAGDTILTSPSTLNPLTQKASFIFRKEGWQTLADTLEVFVEDAQTPLTKAKQITDALSSRSVYNQKTNTPNTQTISSELPDWIWFLLIVLGLVALWVESKFGY